MSGDPSPNRSRASEPLGSSARGLPSIVCAWCGRLMRRGEDPSLVLVSHGLCRLCAHEASHEADASMPA